MKSESIFAEITYQLTGYTSLRRLEFGQVGEPGVYELVLVLARDSDSQSPAISARFRNVSNLAVQDFGGGLTQLLYLAVEDMSSRQWDRARYRVYDAERHMIAFLCSDVAVSSTPD